MVKPSRKYLTIILSILTITALFNGCSKQGYVSKNDGNEHKKEEIKNIEQINQTFSKFQVKNSDKFNSFPMLARVDENKFLVYSGSGNTSIGIYDSNEDSVKIVQRPKIKGNHFFDVVYDKGWLVWSENSDSEVGTDNAKGFNWLVVAKNLSSGEERIIDQAKYKENEFDVPDSYYYCPIYLTINNDSIVYRASDKRESDGKLINKIMLYSISDNNLSTISTSEDMNKECFLYPSNDGTKVMWLDLKEKNNLGRFFYNHNDICYYDIKSKESGKLDLPFENMISKFVFRDNEVYISMEKTATNSSSDMKDRLVKYDISDKSVTDILPSDDEVCLSLQIDKNGYISWDNKNQYNYRLYDIQNNKIIKLVSEEKLKKYAHISYEFDCGILRIFYDKDGNGQQTIECYNLKQS